MEIRLVPRCGSPRMCSQLFRHAREDGHPGLNIWKAALASRLPGSDDAEWRWAAAFANLRNVVLAFCSAVPPQQTTAPMNLPF